MKTQFRLSILAVALFTLMSNVACTKSSSSDDGGTAPPAVAASALSVMPITVAPGGTAILFPSGGTAPYHYSLTSLAGTLQPSVDTTTATFTAGLTTGSWTANVTDSSGQSVQVLVSVTSATSSSLSISPLSSSITAGGTVTFSASGGSGTYTFSATAGTFSQTTSTSTSTFTAPATAQVVTVTISDGGGHSVQTTVTVTGGVTCGGTYNMSLAGYPATLIIVQNTAGTIAGSLTLTGYGYAAAISGSCTSAGVIQFTDLYSGSPYTGNFFRNPSTNKNVIYNGTFSDSYGSYNWSAFEQ